ncbi:ceramidase domain-containing protein [Intrasporangium sp.]|uniref:ceramidase domain-containing protein n=1 Tax=Intrasporangium sp. TaxID=1925024 RepID=UPI00293A6512|nr:ceramidase domain-containing protein [Intrasporangium sp.]MDV3220973.1 ceramidase domain-containing protein [Intrasporangium sp.]
MPSEPRDHRPLIVAAATAVVSLGLVVSGAALGWLGPDTGRGDGFCEAATSGWIRQPANTWSNLAFVVAGLAVARRAGTREGRLWPHPSLATTLSVVIVLLGPGSMAMHATQSSLGGRLDLLSMYLLAAFAAAYAWMRVLRRGLGFFLGAGLAVVITCELVENAEWRVPVVMSGANLAFGVALLLAMLGELVLLRRRGLRRELRWGVAAVAALVLAFTVWTAAKTGAPLCRPDSIAQGHAAWHVLDALAAWFLYRFYASERLAAYR